MKKPKPPKILDAMVSVVLAYKPKPKTKSAKKRKKRAVKIAKAQSSPFQCHPICRGFFIFFFGQDPAVSFATYH